MPRILLSIEEKKARRKATKKKYYEKNKEKNKDKIAARSKKYYKENADKVSACKKKYYQSPAGKKYRRIYDWKKRGLNDKFNDNYETIYKIYMMQEMCGICYKFFNKDNRIDLKCMDHCHKTGMFRRICCNYCNLHTIK